LWPLCTLIRRGQICTLVRRGQFGRRISHTLLTLFVAALSTSQRFDLFRGSQTDFIDPQNSTPSLAGHKLSKSE